MDLNKVQIIGNTTADVVLKQTPNGASVSTVSVATNSKWVNKNTGEVHEEAEYHNIVLWWKLAEIAAKYLKKGKKVYFEGKLKTRSWEKDGVKKYKTEIVADNMIMLSNGGGVNASIDKSDKIENDIMQRQNNAWPAVEEDSISVEDLPF